jgi:hypothetical protein
MKTFVPTPLSGIMTGKGRRMQWDTAGNIFIHTYIHNITPVSLWGRQRSLPSTCYDPYKHLSLLPLSSDSSYTLAGFVLIFSYYFYSASVYLSGMYERDSHIFLEHV